MKKELQMKRNLTLAEAIETIRHYEMVKAQIQSLKLQDSAEAHEVRKANPNSLNQREVANKVKVVNKFVIEAINQVAITPVIPNRPVTSHPSA